jgi:hypothetical protein
LRGAGAGEEQNAGEYGDGETKGVTGVCGHEILPWNEIRHG